jgi:uncharacterized protein (DUF433 family)
MGSTDYESRQPSWDTRYAAELPYASPSVLSGDRSPFNRIVEGTWLCLSVTVRKTVGTTLGAPLTAKALRQGARIGKTMNYLERIERDPGIVGGEPVLKGTRVTLRTILASLAEGATTAEILADFPTLSEEDVRAAIAFAATSAQEDLPLAELPIK